MKFSTSDKDNDARSDWNCATWHGGANWWNGEGWEICGYNNMNGKYGVNGEGGHQFMWWFHYDYFWSLKSMTLMFRQVD